MKTLFYIIWLCFFVFVLVFDLSCVYGTLYPMKYSDEIKQYAASFDVKPEIIASIINVESSYRPNVISSKGAVGLMQLMPETAKWVTERLDEKFDVDDLKIASKNIKFGSFYVSYLLDYFNDLDLAICAYNAGMGNVKKWISNPEIYKDGVLKKVPFNETRKYKNQVLNNINYYKNKY